MSKEKNKKIYVKFENKLFINLQKYLLQNRLEQFAYLFCHTSTSDSDIIVLPKKIVIFEQSNSTYKQQSATGIQIDKNIVNEAYYQFIESDYTAIINCHSHPFQSENVNFSSIDNLEDIREARYILSELTEKKKFLRNNSKIHYISLVFGQKSIAARTYSIKTNQLISIEKITIIDEPIKIYQPTNNKNSIPTLSVREREIYDRQILSFGENGQKIINSLSVSIIGLGGIGSILIEGLSRLGVKKFVLVDHDSIELSNLNRYQGASYQDVGKYKVDVCFDILKKISPDIKVTTIKEKVFSKKALNEIKNTDCILSGLDNAEARFFLNRISLQFCIPFIDSGVVIKSNKSVITKIETRLGIILPGITRCFNCSGINFYDEADARQYFIDSNTKNSLEKRGYIKERPDIKDPSVYSLNMFVSSMVIFEFHNLFTGYKKINWNMYFDYLDLNGKYKKSLNTKDDYEAPTGKCVTCELYKSTGDFESLNFFINRNKSLILAEV